MCRYATPHLSGGVKHYSTDLQFRVVPESITNPKSNYLPYLTLPYLTLQIYLPALQSRLPQNPTCPHQPPDFSRCSHISPLRHLHRQLQIMSINCPRPSFSSGPPRLSQMQKQSIMFQQTVRPCGEAIRSSQIAREGWPTTCKRRVGNG